MSYSNVQLANLALSYCGHTQQITSLTDDDSVGARACNLHFAPTRDALLERFSWPFATKYVALQLEQEFEDGDNEAMDWGFSYRVPTNDCLRVRRIVTAEGQQPTEAAPFQVMQDDAGILLLTDEEDPIIEYTARFDNPAFFSPTFAKAFAWALAAEISFALSVSEQVRQRALDMAERTLAQAKVSALSTVQPQPSQDSSFLQARE
jgi:hypothetical protein